MATPVDIAPVGVREDLLRYFQPGEVEAMRANWDAKPEGELLTSSEYSHDYECRLGTIRFTHTVKSYRLTV